MYIYIYIYNDLACPKMAPRSRADMQQRAETLDDALIRELLELRAERAHLHKISSRAQVQEQCDGGVRSMELLLQQQKSTGVLETNSLTIMPELPLLLLPHIPPWHILFLAQSNCVLRGRITATSVTVPRQRRSVMVRSRRMMLLLRQPKYTSVLESNSPPLMPAMLLLLSPHIRLQQY